MTDRSSWNMARIASRRRLPRELKLHPTTVGKPMSSQAGIGAWHREWVNEDEVACCSTCGYHWCNCKPVSKARSVGQHHCCGEYVCRCKAFAVNSVMRGEQAEALSYAVEQHNARQERARAEDARRMRGMGGAADWPDYGTTEGI